MSSAPLPVPVSAVISPSPCPLPPPSQPLTTTTPTCTHQLQHTPTSGRPASSAETKALRRKMLAELITSTTSTMPPPPKVPSRQRRCVAAAAAAVVAVLVFIGALPTVAAQAHPSTGSTLVMNLTSDSAQDARCSCDGCRRGFGRADGSLDRDVDLSAYHWVQRGVARSGSTVQFQILCISLALQLADKQPAMLPNLTCSFEGASPGTLEGPYVSKTHGGTFNLSPRQWRALGLDPGGPPTTYLDTVDRDPANGVVVFITERRKSAALVSPDVRANGHKVPLVVDLDDFIGPVLVLTGGSMGEGIPILHS